MPSLVLHVFGLLASNWHLKDEHSFYIYPCHLLSLPRLLPSLEELGGLLLGILSLNYRTNKVVYYM